MGMQAAGSIGSATVGVIGALSSKRHVARLKPASGREKVAQDEAFRRLLSAGQGFDRGSFEQSMLAPSFYEEAGYTPEYDQASFGEATAARSKSDQVESLAYELKGLKRGKANKARRKEIKAQLKTMTGRKKAAGARARALKDAETQEAEAGRITGLKRKRLGTAGEQELTDILRQRALDAARTGKSTDPRLNRELDEAEGDIRARLSRQFGADYENTTGGQMALNSFRQRKTESLADFARKDIEYEGKAQEFEKTLGDLAGQRMRLASYPSATRMQTSAQGSDLAGKFADFENLLRSDRLAEWQVNDYRSQVKQQNQQAVYGSMVRAFDMLNESGKGVSAGAGGSSMGG